MGFGQPEAVGAAPPWVNPDVAGGGPPVGMGVDRGPELPPELAAQIASAGGAPTAAPVTDTAAQDAQSISGARAALNDLISQLSWIQRMAIQGAGIDLDIFSSGLFGKDDVQRLYQFMLQNKDKVGPEIWAQIEMINEALG